MKKIISWLMTFVLVVSFFSFSASAQTVTVNQYLMSIGIPESVIDLMPEGQKQLIYETSYGVDSSFSGFDIYEYCVEDGIVLKNQVSYDNDNAVMPRMGNIPSSQLTLSVLGIKQNVTSNGVTTVRYAIYPTFVWQVIQCMANDSFAFCMYPGWEVLPQMVNLRVHYSNSPGGSSIGYTNYAPVQSTSSGYSFSCPQYLYGITSYYQGNAYFYAEKKDSNASPRISMTYVDDRSPTTDVSYSIGIYGASISVSSTNEYIYALSGNYTISNIS